MEDFEGAVGFAFCVPELVVGHVWCVCLYCESVAWEAALPRPIAWNVNPPKRCTLQAISLLLVSAYQ